jgi:hypothetical protein
VASAADQLPPGAVDYVAAGLRTLRAGQPLLTFGWD